MRIIGGVVYLASFSVRDRHGVILGVGMLNAKRREDGAWILCNKHACGSVTRPELKGSNRLFLVVGSMLNAKKREHGTRSTSRTNP